MSNRNAAMKVIQRKELEDNLRGVFELTLPDRVRCCLEVKPHPIIPNTHFAAVSTQCTGLFRDGQFYGCIALTQSVTEALVRFVCQKNSCKVSKEFETNIATLNKRKFLSDELKGHLLKIWER